MAELASAAGVSTQALYQWSKKLKKQGSLLSQAIPCSEAWSSAQKFAIVLETAALNETERAEFCRQRGLLVEQAKADKPQH
ncbi:hypothetical protein EHS17_07645 [Rhodobacteraceae bacterium CH30]|nr:hypothetical protein EHS17_07645 [Rhodobacteraceae bacterium CH30]